MKPHSDMVYDWVKYSGTSEIDATSRRGDLTTEKAPYDKDTRKLSACQCFVIAVLCGAEGRSVPTQTIELQLSECW